VIIREKICYYKCDVWFSNIKVCINDATRTHICDLTNKDAWPPNSPDLNALDTMFGMDAREVQKSESTTEEHLGTKALGLLKI